MDRLVGADATVADLKRADVELRGRLDRYAVFHRDLERSAAWRAIQFVRRLFGRAW